MWDFSENIHIWYAIMNHVWLMIRRWYGLRNTKSHSSGPRRILWNAMRCDVMSSSSSKSILIISLSTPLIFFRFLICHKLIYYIIFCACQGKNNLYRFYGYILVGFFQKIGWVIIIFCGFLLDQIFGDWLNWLRTC